MLVFVVLAFLLPTSVISLPDEGFLIPRYKNYKRNAEFNELYFGNNPFRDTYVRHYRSVSFQIDYYMFRDPNRGKLFQVDDPQSLADSGFDKSKPTKIIIHGFHQRGINTDLNQLLRSKYFRRGSYNIISVDWSSACFGEEFAVARTNLGYVGQQIGDMVNFLVSVGAPLRSISLIGHGMGAHLSGVIGRRVENGKAFSIVALNPSGPFFYSGNPNRLRVTDAHYVVVIHSDNALGYHAPLGDADFYPNGGVHPQPGCGEDILSLCSYDRAIRYFAESLESSRFFAKQCSNYFNVNDPKCPDGPRTAFMGGEPIDDSVKGLYVLKTNSRSPFAKG